MSADAYLPWRVAGSYLESCNCEAICPCRQVGGKRPGRSTYEWCTFILSWLIEDGQSAGVGLNDLHVVMAGSYSDDEPGSPWRVILYVDERATAQQRAALEAIFLGRAGGTALENYAANIEEVLGVRAARIQLDHDSEGRLIRVADAVFVSGAAPHDSDERVSCGIPGHDHPGRELVFAVQRVDDDPLAWEVAGRCGFETRFDYVSSHSE
jgi:hypothetical protein